MNRWMCVGGVAGVFAATAGAMAGVPLSDYMGKATGEVVTGSYPPYMTVVKVAEYGGFGVDISGAFIGGETQLKDVGSLRFGVGAHPASSIEFNLAEIRAAAGEPLEVFRARVGIEKRSGMPDGNGAEFKVYRDGVLAVTKKITDLDASEEVEVDVKETAVLRLETAYVSFGYNWAVWGLARLERAEGAYMLRAPARAGVHVPLKVEFDWDDVPGAESYTLIVARDHALTDVVTTREITDGSSQTIIVGEGIKGCTDYWWGVRAERGGQTLRSTPSSDKFTTKIPGDFNEDGKLNINDFIAMQAAWRAKDPRADINGDGRFTVNDFIAFQGLFVRGCS